MIPLSINDIEDLKKQGYSDSQIRMALSEIEKEDLKICWWGFGKGL